MSLLLGAHVSLLDIRGYATCGHLADAHVSISSFWAPSGKASRCSLLQRYEFSVFWRLDRRDRN